MLARETTVAGDVATTTTATATTPTVTATAAVALACREAHNEGGEAVASSMAVGGSNLGEDDKSRVLDEADRAFFGNRWPRQETLTLLKIRSEMDVAFRDASVKGPLWEEVSRKLGELGYNRSAKKCREKFENVYKYHKRTREGRTGKIYRFFDQLEVFENHPSFSSPSPKPQAPAAATVVPVSVAMPSANPPRNINTVPPPTYIATQNIVTIPATNLTTIPSFPSANPTNLPPQQSPNPTNFPSQTQNQFSFNNISADLLSISTSSSTSSDLEMEGSRKKKRKWRDFFERLMKEVMGKQEELQKKFLEAIEKREHERMVREEAWRMQEMTRINREREILAQERSISAAKDAAVTAFLQKLAEQQNPGQVQNNNISIPPPTISPTPPPDPPPSQPPSHPPQPLPSPPASTPQPKPQSQPAVSLQIVNLDTMKTNNGDPTNSFMPTSSSRWPKVEVQALIKLRTNLDSKYQENGPKGPLWEEISAGMRKSGYNRNAKRCKEKWENINKYFKKVKESNKKRPDDSKTCPYFHQLDVLYKEKNKFDHSTSNQLFKPENSVPLMVRPEQQWPPQPEHRMLHQDSAMEDVESDHNVEEDDKDVEDEEGGFEIVPNKQVNSNDSKE